MYYLLYIIQCPRSDKSRQLSPHLTILISYTQLSTVTDSKLSLKYIFMSYLSLPIDQRKMRKCERGGTSPLFPA